MHWTDAVDRTQLCREGRKYRDGEETHGPQHKCIKAFSQYSDLKKQGWEDTAGPCNKCLKAFSEYSDLKKHLQGWGGYI